MMIDGTEKQVRARAWSYVAAQGVLLIALVLPGVHWGAHLPSSAPLGWLLAAIGIAGILICAAKLRNSLTAVPIPKEDGELAMTGLYRYARHPMYTSVLIFALGVAVGSGSELKYLLFIALVCLLYFKSKYEEIFLLKKYPQYEFYIRQTPRFIPFTKK